MSKLTAKQRMVIYRTPIKTLRVGWLSRSKWEPHQGKQECERRRAQAKRDAA